MNQDNIIDIEDLTPDAHNFNQGTDEGRQLMQRSLSELGAGRSILVDRNGNVIAGNKTQEAAIKAGIRRVRVIETDGTELVAVKRTDIDIDSAKGRELALVDNLATQVNLAWDEAELEAMDVEGFDPGQWGWEPPEMGDNTEQGQGEQPEAKEDDFDPDEVHETKVKRGDVWQLGEHRLMCGDSTNADDVARLMNGERADIAFTSPPYGVNDGSLREHKVAGQSSHADDNFYLEHDDNMGTWPDLIEKSWQNMNNNSDQQFINIQMLRDNKRELMHWASRHADNLSDIIIWDKTRAAPQMRPNIVNNTFEFIYVFGEKESTRVLKYGNFRGNVSAIIRIDVGQNEFADVHKAVFPVALPAEILNINSNAKSVLDLFGGTGTTMIAAEQLGRKCFMMELDPHYCDVIIARWEKLTGGKATKLNP